MRFAPSDNYSDLLLGLHKYLLQKYFCFIEAGIMPKESLILKGLVYLGEKKQ